MQTLLHRLIPFALAAAAVHAELAADTTVTAVREESEREAVLDAQEVRSARQVSPAPRRVLGREELSRASSLAALLSQEPGMVVRRTGGLGGAARLSMRGSPTEQVEVYLDGQPLGGSTGSAVDLGPISLDGLERVEIAQAGADGAGAAPRIDLRSRQGWSRTGLSLRGGSFGERAVAARWGDPSGRLALAGWYERADNDYEVPWDNGTLYNTGDDRVVKLSNNAYTGRGAAAALRPVPSLDLLLRAEDSRRGVSAPGWDDPHASMEGSSLLGSARWSGEAAFLRPEAALSARWFRSSWTDPDRVSGYDVDRGSEEDALDGSASLRLRREGAGWLDGWVGADLRLERSERTSTGRVDVPVTPSGGRRTLGAEAGWVGRNPSSTFGAEASLRGERMDDERDWTEDLGDVSTGGDIGTGWTGARAAGRIWGRPLAGWTLWLAGARRVRPPDFREWMGDNGFTLRTPDLEVETSSTGEFGNRLALGPFDGTLEAWIASYEDPIEAFQRGASPLVSHRNAPGYVAGGVDARISLDARVARLSAGGTLQEAAIGDPNPSMDGNRPRRFPLWKAFGAVASAPFHGVSAGTDLELQGRTFASELNRPSDLRDGRTFLGTWIRWNGGGFSVAFSLNNILDEHPEDFEDIPLAGRQFAFRIDYEHSAKPTRTGDDP